MATKNSDVKLLYSDTLNIEQNCNFDRRYKLILTNVVDSITSETCITYVEIRTSFGLVCFLFGVDLLNQVKNCALDCNLYSKILYPTYCI